MNNNAEAASVANTMGIWYDGTSAWTTTTHQYTRITRIHTYYKTSVNEVIKQASTKLHNAKGTQKYANYVWQCTDVRHDRIYAKYRGEKYYAQTNDSVLRN